MSSKLESVGGSTPCNGRTALVLDVVERVLLLCLYAWLLVRILKACAEGGSPVNLLMLPTEGLVVLLVLIRRTTSHVSQRPIDWLLAAAATIAPLVVQPEAVAEAGLVPPVVAAVAMVAGLLVQVHAKVVLGRSFGCVPANRGLKFSGPYRFVRHPIYAGYLLGHLAFLAMNPTAWNLSVYALCYALQVPRLLAEERWLSKEPQYAAYMRQVHHRLVPGIF